MNCETDASGWRWPAPTRLGRADVDAGFLGRCRLVPGLPRVDASTVDASWFPWCALNLRKSPGIQAYLGNNPFGSINAKNWVATTNWGSRSRPPTQRIGVPTREDLGAVDKSGHIRPNLGEYGGFFGCHRIARL